MGDPTKENEPLKDVMVRYKEVLQKISNVDLESAMTALKNGPWHKSRFKLEMIVNRPPTLEDAIHRAANYARAEEELASLAKKHMVKKKAYSNTWTREDPKQKNGRGIRTRIANSIKLMTMQP